MLLVLSAFFDAVLAWAILRMVLQSRLYASISLVGNGFASEPDGGWPPVTVVVPARDEADVVGQCVGSLLAQDYPRDRLRVILVDDGSTDGTAFVARAAAGGDPRLRIVPGGVLAHGWTGKCHACAGGAALARDGWLCFIDADARAEPELLRAAVAYGAACGFGLLSLEPFQELGGAADRLVMPCGLYLIAATSDYGAVNDARSDAAAANGQFMLFAPGVYADLGGHGAVRAEVCEDLALARRAKRQGICFALLGAETLIRTRMYRDAAQLWHGLSKNVTVLGGGARRTMGIAAGGLALALGSWLLPILAIERLTVGPGDIQDIGAAGLAFCGLFAAMGLHIAGTRHFRIPMVYGLLYLAGYTLAFALAVNAARLRRNGSVRWKGRTVETSGGVTP